MTSSGRKSVPKVTGMDCGLFSMKPNRWYPEGSAVKSRVGSVAMDNNDDFVAGGDRYLFSMKPNRCAAAGYGTQEDLVEQCTANIASINSL